MGATIYNESTTEPLPYNGECVCVWGGGGGLNSFYWYQIFAIDSVVVKTQKSV